MKIAVVGTGYVGLVSAACFADLGHTVIGVDIDPAKVEMLRQGKSPIFEPGLEELLRKGLAAGSLSFTTSVQEALPGTQLLFCAVATPPGEAHKADLTAVFSVAEEVASHAEQNVVFITKSTVPVGTGHACEQRIAGLLQERGKQLEIPVISNPEFLREGSAVSDTLAPERIVVGINGTDWARDLMEELYHPLTREGAQLVIMNRESAEMVKYASNAFLATKISFINMLSELAEVSGADIRDVARGMGLDSRIGHQFLAAGIGYGGSCFPKDVKALIATGKEHSIAMTIAEATEAVNAHQRQRFTKQILDALKTPSRIAVWGLSFKPKTDDMREAPSLDIIPALIKAGHTVIAYDPAATDRAKPLLPEGVVYAHSPMEAAKNADALVLLTDWDVFKGVDLKTVASAMKGKWLFDGRNLYEPADAMEAGFDYRGIGISVNTEA